MTLSNLPVQLTSFIGRERELAEVKHLVSTMSLVTLTGPGGSGKTRLAIQAATEMASHQPDGIWLVDFAPLREPGLVTQHIAQTLGLRPAPDQTLTESLLNFLRPKELLLILDNCEHLLAACAALIQQMLNAAAGLKIVATSRQPLGVSGEVIYHVEGLAWPSSDSSTVWNLQELELYDAVHLFVERARAISSQFSLTSENASAMIEICRRLDGIPLALELASARVNVLTPQQIDARLNDRFALLTSNQRTLLISHHHTLRAAIDWSYDLLTPEEQILLGRLGMFAGSFTLETVEYICAGDGIHMAATLDLLASLVDKSLVVAETIGRAEARYRLLETIREYALEKLKEAGEETRLRDRHLDLFVSRAEDIAPKLESSSYQNLWLNWLDGEQDNLRAALDWSLHGKRIETGLRLAISLIWYWRLHSSDLEIRTWLERLLERADETISLEVRASAAMYASVAAAGLSDSAASIAHGRAAVALCEAMGEAGRSLLANSLIGLARAAQATGDWATGLQACDRATVLFRELGDMSGLLITLFGQTMGALALGNYLGARRAIDEGLAVAQKADNPYLLALAVNLLGDLERFEGNYEAARSAYERSLDGLRQIGAARDQAAVLHNLAHAHLHQGNLEQAFGYLRESLSMQREQEHAQGMAECLIGFGALAFLAGMPARAALLLAAATTLGGRALLVQWPAERMEYDHYLTSVRAQVSDQVFDAAQRKGSNLTMEQAVEYALSLPLLAETAEIEFGSLTGREREVAAMIGQGKANSEIAAELVLSKRTVEKHIANILSKLGFTTRAQVVRWVMEHRLPNTSI